MTANDDSAIEPRPTHVLLELCCGGIKDVLLAARHNVERIELNTAMALGGLTPTAALMAAARREFSGPIIAMLRPREGGFCYSNNEFNLMLDDARRLRDLGADGFATGFLKSDGSLDDARFSALRTAVPDCELVCHRAFDIVSSRDAAMEQLVDCGIQRVLTSGGAAIAIEGARELRRLNALAAGRIEILAGGGVRAANVRQLTASSGCRQVHSSAQSVVDESLPMNSSGLHFGVHGKADGSYVACDESTLRELMAELELVNGRW